MSQIDDDLEDQQAVEELAKSIKSFVKKRCCVFMEGGAYSDIIHGRFMGFIREFPALVIRDLTPGRERLQRTRMVGLEMANNICWCDSLEKCQQCPTYKELQEMESDEPDGELEPEGKKVDGQSDDT